MTKYADWKNPATLSRLRQLAESRICASQIARVLSEEGHGDNISRNAVSKKLRRLGFVHGELPTVWPEPKPRAAPRVVERASPKDPDEPMLCLPLTGLTNGVCKWSVAENAQSPFNHRFCGLPVARPGERPYCKAHSLRAYVGLSEANYNEWLDGKFIVPRRRK